MVAGRVGFSRSSSSQTSAKRLGWYVVARKRPPRLGVDRRVVQKLRLSGDVESSRAFRTHRVVPIDGSREPRGACAAPVARPRPATPVILAQSSSMTEVSRGVMDRKPCSPISRSKSCPGSAR